MRGAPQSGFSPADQCAYLFADARPPAAVARFPAPSGSKSVAMPANDCFRFNDGYGIENAWRQTIKKDKQGAICSRQSILWSPAQDDSQLMAKGNVLGLDFRHGAEPVANETNKKNNQRPHRT